MTRLDQILADPDAPAAELFAAVAEVTRETHPSRRERVRRMHRGREKAVADHEQHLSRMAASDARIDHALARLDASIESSREFWTAQEAAREADCWEAAWGRAGL
jgi:septal ring factor EnvC (AmiA/AmiB activator)